MRTTAFALTVLLASRVAHADDAKDACLDSHARAQVLRMEGKYRAAQDELRVCGRSKCPALVARDCAAWLSELTAEQPTVIVTATDENGHETADVQIAVDGQPLASRLDGLPVPVDPGEHVFRYRSPHGNVVEERVMVRAKEKGRALRISFPPPPKAAPPLETHRTIPAASWIAGGVGVAAGGVWAFFALTGKARESSLADSCAPGCSQSDIEGVSTRYLIADVAMAVTLVSLASAVVFALVAKPSPRRAALAPAALVTF
jgi:hypothetical protein